MNKKISALVLTLTLLCGCDRNIENSGGISIGDTDFSSVSSAGSSFSENGSLSTPDGSSSSDDGGSVDSGAESSVNSDDMSAVESVQRDLVFVDYELNGEPDIINDKSALGEVYDKAVAALKATEQYDDFLTDFRKDKPMGLFLHTVDDFFDENGIPVPVFSSAYTDDLDCDGKQESFVLISMPVMVNGGDLWFEREFLIFVGDEAETISDYYGAVFESVLNYGCCKQIIVASSGWNGSDSHSDIWGVQNGKAADLYGGRLAYEKTDCFLTSFGPQGIGDFTVFDIKNGEYLAIQGKKLNTEDVLAMDSTGMLNEYKENLDNGWFITLLGGKYYIISGGYHGGISYVYENGAFVKTDKSVRLSVTPGLTGGALNTVSDIDYEKALTEMISPEEAGAIA